MVGEAEATGGIPEPRGRPGIPGGIPADRDRAEEGARGGGAIMAANGSLDAEGAGAGAAVGVGIDVGGGPIDAGTSLGSSPGKIHRFCFSS